VSPAFYPNPRQCKHLIESCSTLNLNLHLFGFGEPWPGYVEAKVVRLLWEIERIECDHVMVTDAVDSFVMADEEEIMECFKSSGSECVISAEKNCWPYEALARHYPKSISPWRYVNSGGFMGTKDAICKLLREMHDSLSASNGGYEQFTMSLVYLNGFPAQLDTLCRLFQTASDARREEFAWHGNRLYNTVTKSYSCVIHFNGHTAGIEKTFERRFSPCVSLKVTSL
jgi:hypothetical protein